MPAFCRACGAPLRLPDESPPPPLSDALALDRRGDPEATREGVAPPPLRAPAAPRARPQPPDELAELERSHWDLGVAVADLDEPVFAPAAAVAPSPAPPRPPGGAASPPRRPAAPTHPAGAPPAPRAGTVEVHVRRAEPWRRAGAWAIDGLPFAAGAIALVRAFVREAAAGGPAAGGLDLLDLVARERVIVLSVVAAAVVAVAVYATLAHALAGATLGKRLLGLRVVGPDGERPTLARSAARSGLAALSLAALGLGFLLALFTPSGRALHDLASRTWVVEA